MVKVVRSEKGSRHSHNPEKWFIITKMYIAGEGWNAKYDLPTFHPPKFLLAIKLFARNAAKCNTGWEIMSGTI